MNKNIIKLEVIKYNGECITLTTDEIFYNTGLCTQPFFKKTSNLVFSQDFLSDTLRDNYDVFLKHYYSEIETEGKSESQICMEMMDLVLAKISGDLLCFQPLT
jgi:hypothetical protein